MLRCHACDTNAVVRVNVVRDHQPLCNKCIYRPRAARAQRLGAELRTADTYHHYGHFRLDFGNVVRRQYLRLAKPLMMDGGTFLTMTNYDVQKVVDHDNIMGP